jgi:transposase
MSKVVKLGSGEVDLSRPKRRRFGAEYKLRILAEVDSFSQPGQIAGLVRREGLYWSHILRWRREREEGVLNALLPVQRGPKPKERNPLEAELKQVQKEKRILERRLRRAELLLDIQKKASELMGITLDPQLQDDESD